MDNLKNGVLIYYQNGYFKVDEIKEGIWTNRQSKWVGELNPDKMLEISPNYKNYVVIGLPNTNEEDKMQWFNFITGAFETVSVLQTDEEALQYIPNMPAAQGLFKCHKLMGKSIEEAMVETLTSCIGIDIVNDLPKPKKWWEFWK